MKLITDDSGVYYVVFNTRKGTEGKVCLATKDETDAQERALAMRVPELETVSSVVDLSHQVVTQIITGKDLSVTDAVQMWFEQVKSSRVLSPTTLHCNHRFILHWIKEAGLDNKPLTGVQPKDVSDYVNRGGERRSSAVRKLSAIRSFFAWCNEEGILYRNPAGSRLCKVTYDVFNHEEKELRERGVFTDSELDGLIKVASPFWKAAIVIGRSTGLRLGDIATLEWSSFKDGRLIVWTDKANKRVDLEVTHEIETALAALPSTDIRYVFPTVRDIALDPTKRAVLSVQFSRLCAKAGITGKSFHCLRHTNATGLVHDGASLEIVAQRLGHGSTKVTAGYVHGRPAS